MKGWKTTGGKDKKSVLKKEEKHGTVCVTDRHLDTQWKWFAEQHWSKEALIKNTGLRDKPGEPTIGRIAGTGTAVGGTETKVLGCQLRWRFFGGPEFIAEDTDHQTDTRNNVNNTLFFFNAEKK